EFQELGGLGFGGRQSVIISLLDVRQGFVPICLVLGFQGVVAILFLFQVIIGFIEGGLSAGERILEVLHQLPVGAGVLDAVPTQVRLVIRDHFLDGSAGFFFLELGLQYLRIHGGLVESRLILNERVTQGRAGIEGDELGVFLAQIGTLGFVLLFFC